MNKNLIPSYITPRMKHINKLLGKNKDNDYLQPSLSTNNNSKLSKGIFFSPLAKKVALENNVDIAQVPSSSESGRVSINDVLIFIKNKDTTPIINSINTEQKNISQNNDILSTHDVERIKVSPIRKTIANVMKKSWASVAYTNLYTEVDMTKLWELRASVKARVKEKHNVNLTFLAFILKALAIAIKEYPNMNAIYDEQSSELVLKKYYNFGIAVDTSKGLIVPVIKNIDKLGIIQIATEIVRLGLAARNNKLTKDDISGGTFSVTNYGSFGAIGGVPVINYPELAIAGIGAFTDKIVLKNGQVYTTKSMMLTLAADHRWIDGGDIAKFTRRVKQILEEPALLWFEEEVQNV